MRILIAIILAAGAIGWALVDREPERQFAASVGVPRQISQISR
nr:hypothetical protein [uncultured Roseococcus sp.]